MPADMTRYPENWNEISHHIRFERGEGVCECTGDKHDKMDVREENLKGMCQRCHLLFDLDDHIAHARTTRTSTKLKALIDAGQLQMGL